MKNQFVQWALRIIPAFIMIQTLYFKFTGAEESVYIFSAVGMEPVGRYGSGVAELIASILLLITTRYWFGAVIGIAIMAGAIATHLFVIGIEVMNDNGQLFVYAVVTLVCCLIIIWQAREEIKAYVLCNWHRIRRTEASQD